MVFCWLIGYSLAGPTDEPILFKLLANSITKHGYKIKFKIDLLTMFGYISFMPFIVIRLKTEELLKLMALRGFRSRAALAKNAGIHQQHMSKIFLGQVDPTIKTLAKLCRALDCQPGELIEYIPDPV